MHYSNKKSILTGLAVIALLMVIPFSAHADVVFVGGDVSGTWSADSVIVSDSIYVSPGNSLEIEPGTHVIFLAAYSFRVYSGAVLRAVGTETDSISFLPAVEGYNTLGIDFEDASDESIMEYCYFSHALYSAIAFTNSKGTIRNCLLEDNHGYYRGGGISVLDSSDAIIENNTIRNNDATSQGGAIYCEASAPIIQGNIIQGNRTGAIAGAICCNVYSSPKIIGNRFIDNQVYPLQPFPPPAQGGAIYCSDESSPMVLGNLFLNNRVNPGGDSSPYTYNGGGAIFVFSASPVIMNNVFVGNEAYDEGGAIILFNSNAQMINNIFFNNSADAQGGCVYIVLSSFPEIVNSILYDNSAPFGPAIYLNNSELSVTYSNFQGGWQGEGNIDVDPLFRDPVSGDYHLMAIECGDPYDSPCIDAGDPGLQDSLLDCAWGLGTVISDMGAYGGADSGLVGIDIPQTTTPAKFSLVHNYPNPFNASTIIRYELPVQSHLKIDIFDALGRIVTTLRNGMETAGYHQVVWDAGDISSGMYFYKLQVNDYGEVKKMMLVK